MRVVFASVAWVFDIYLARLKKAMLTGLFGQAHSWPIIALKRTRLPYIMPEKG